MPDNGNDRDVDCWMRRAAMIWVVTDDATTRGALTGLIRGKGYKADGIECGDEVVKRLRFQMMALAVIDCSLPDSFELIGKIRAEPRTRSVPVILFTRADENLREKALLKGADAYVPRGSLDWLELLAEIQRFAGPAKD
jgi:CheY-like chemotaxis protein